MLKWIDSCQTGILLICFLPYKKPQLYPTSLHARALQERGRILSPDCLTREACRPWGVQCVMVLVPWMSPAEYVQMGVKAAVCVGILRHLPALCCLYSVCLWCSHCTSRGLCLVEVERPLGGPEDKCSVLWEEPGNGYFCT